MAVVLQSEGLREGGLWGQHSPLCRQQSQGFVEAEQTDRERQSSDEPVVNQDALARREP